MIQPADPLSSYLEQRRQIVDAIVRVLDSGSYILGSEVHAFEAEFSQYLGSPRAVGVASGTDALQIALRALGIGPGDSVLTVSHTAVATVAAIEMTGARAVLVDVEPEGMTMSPESLAGAIGTLGRSHRFRAVIPVHLYGRPANIEALLEIADSGRLAVVEDCAQAHGAEAGGRKVGTFGDFGAFSFYPTKNLGALGDAGAVVSGDAELAERASALREYGWRQRYVSDEVGVNSRLDPLQAAVLRVKLPMLNRANERRRRIAAMYRAGLAGTSYLLPDEASGHVYHQYVIRTGRRDELKAFLAERGVNSLVHYPQPVHLQPAYRGRLDLAPGGLPVTEAACRQILSIPVQPTLSDGEVEKVIELLRAFDS
jgi:dTDP-4-amino-4,6-dideoxygalactose transaminase